jgi:long-subunit acyl-CoA synthetase (AMP-forming)
MEVRAQIQADLARIASENHFNSLEKIKSNFELVDTDFEKTTGILTPTMKIKRKNAREHFSEHIKRIYLKTDEKI